MQALSRALHGWKEHREENQRIRQSLAAALQRWRQNLLSRAFYCMKDHAVFRQQARQVVSHVEPVLCIVRCIQMSRPQA